jgi:hypothetical protein
VEEEIEMTWEDEEDEEWMKEVYTDEEWIDEDSSQRQSSVVTLTVDVDEEGIDLSELELLLEEGNVFDEEMATLDD